MAKPKEDDRDIFEKALESPTALGVGGAIVGGLLGRAGRRLVRKKPMTKAQYEAVRKAAHKDDLRGQLGDKAADKRYWDTRRSKLNPYEMDMSSQFSAGVKGAAVGGATGASLASMRAESRRKK